MREVHGRLEVRAGHFCKQDNAHRSGQALEYNHYLENHCQRGAQATIFGKVRAPNHPMNSTWSREKFTEVSAKLFQRAATDAAFRQLCLKDARAAVKEISGMDLPPNNPLRFAEPQPGVLILPPFQKARELSEQEMERVAGGSNLIPATYEDNSGTICCTMVGVGGC
jgi:hypothetical protein